MRTSRQPHRFALALLLAASACVEGTPPDELETGSLEQGLRVCAGPATVPGIDVSEWQGGIDWPQVAGAGYKFAIARINDGHHMDPYFQGHWAAIKSVGLVRGAYQFYEPTIDPTTQANWVINAVGLLGPGDLPVMLDVEWTTGTPNAGDIGTWISLVTAGTGKIPMIYTALGYWNQYFTTEFSDLDLVVANYGVQCPALPSSWDHWFMWQWGGAPVPGIAGNVDQDLFNGTLDELNFAAGQNAGSGCTAGGHVACSHFGCGCADRQCSGGYCPGTGCSAVGVAACGHFGCGCTDNKCNGGYCPGAGCTAKEANDCAHFGCNCVDHQCAGGFCPGSGCTAKETNDCSQFGCGCVDHQCAGAFCPGSGCTAKQAKECSDQGKACAMGACADAPDAGSTAPDAGTPDAGSTAPDAGTPDAGSAPPDAGPTSPDAGTVADAGLGADAGDRPPEEPPGSGGDAGCGGCAGAGVGGPAIVLVGLVRRRRRA